MNTDRFHVDTYDIETEHAQQLLHNAIWAEHIHHHGRKNPIIGRLRPRGTVILRVNTEQRDDAHTVLEHLHTPGTDYTARWMHYPAGNRDVWQVRLTTPGHPDITIAGPRTPRTDRAFRTANHITILPKTVDGTNTDTTRTTTITNDREFWQHTTRRRTR